MMAVISVNPLVIKHHRSVCKHMTEKQSSKAQEQLKASKLKQNEENIINNATDCILLPIHATTKAQYSLLEVVTSGINK